MKHWLLLSFLVIALTALAFLRISTFKVEEQNVIASLQARQSEGSITFFQVVSDSISFVSLGIPALFVAFGLVKKRKELTRSGLLILLSIALAGSISAVIKRTLKEPRPYEVDSRIKQLSVGGSNSFPSGHTAEASAAALGFMLILFRNRLSMFLSVIWAGTIMLSRIVLGVHNFTDILAGIAVGSMGLLLMNAIFKKWWKVE